MKSVLEICGEVADMAATKRPEDLFNRSSLSDSIFLSIAKSALDSLLRYGDWQELTKEGGLRTSGERSNYLLADVCPDFYALLNNTIYIKDSKEKVIGAVTPEDWMKEKYLQASSGGVRFKIQNGMLKFLTPPADGLKIVFQYRTNTICFEASSYVEKSELTANTDIPVFDDYLVKLGILWRWLKRNGMDYAEEYAEYEREIKKKFASSLAVKDICLGGGEKTLPEGVTINVHAGY
ncbi:MAG: hypothetical protein SOU80_06095 [Alphaproteobacteria bacterium]|nr:hypothetical protein [Alphaproteobacteria bacterium]